VVAAILIGVGLIWIIGPRERLKQEARGGD